MKKIALFSVLVCLLGINTVWAGCDYEEPRDGSPSDEDIFFASAKPDYSKGIPKAIVCGTQKSKKFCENGTWVYVPGEHYQDGVRSNAVYSCSTSGNTAWNIRYLNMHSEQLALPKCKNDVSGYAKLDFNEYSKDQGRAVVGKPVAGGRAYVDVCWKECEDCKEQEKRDEQEQREEDSAHATPGKCSFVGEILSGPRLCSTYDKNMSSNAAARTGKECTNVCLKSQSGSFVQQIAIHNCEHDKIENRTFPDSVLNVFNAESQSKLKGYIYRCDDKAESGNKTCEQLYPNGSPERLACCRSGKATKWTGTATSGTCECVDTTKQWSYTAGARNGQCVDKQQNGPVELSDCYYRYDVSIKCANGNTYREKGSEPLSKSQLAGLSCADFNARFGTDIKKWQDLYGDLCKAHNADKPQGPSEDELSGALNRIESFTKYAESNKSVWKDSEGKFNTARLASDLTAGVVLGTVGGVVSGVVIKKKQIEKGFEVLHCTVGGQKVADWGDTFSVGFRR